MEEHWYEPRPGIYVGKLEDGRIVIETRVPSESFRQGGLLRTDWVPGDDFEKLPADLEEPRP